MVLLLLNTNTLPPKASKLKIRGQSTSIHKFYFISWQINEVIASLKWTNIQSNCWNMASESMPVPKSWHEHTKQIDADFISMSYVRVGGHGFEHFLFSEWTLLRQSDFHWQKSRGGKKGASKRNNPSRELLWTTWPPRGPQWKAGVDQPG